MLGNRRVTVRSGPFPKCFDARSGDIDESRNMGALLVTGGEKLVGRYRVPGYIDLIHAMAERIKKKGGLSPPFCVDTADYFVPFRFGGR